MNNNALLEMYLRQPRLPTFMENYPSFAADAAINGLDHIRYLRALVEQEIQTRDQSRIQRRIKAARFPGFKELSDPLFSTCVSVYLSILCFSKFLPLSRDLRPLLQYRTGRAQTVQLIFHHQKS